MPRKSPRREMLADAALTLLDESGLSSVTHRALDQAAGVPPGTASNYFRTRTALYEAIARRLLDLQLAELAELDRRAAWPRTPDELVELLASFVEAGSGPARNRYLARLELSLHAAWNPGLAEVMRELRGTTLKIISARVRAIHPSVSDEQLDALGSALTGVTLDRMTLGVPAMDVREIMRALVRGLVGSRADIP
ncbi:TetR/AcrR family transcriptional regulator [Nonomuraea sp. NN258]|uniref:TetR/AcrR family transcriptional regulator n=1 Tax=Nonomuraea antri TaxID=2730852 RepID=UPI001569A40F|nr:TetR family transcriptional regulator [Nonomuraea antri]NRQ36520.1 TetR/AcrR family transcriptional regulator [Nonomuraea antri]